MVAQARGIWGRRKRDVEVDEAGSATLAPKTRGRVASVANAEAIENIGKLVDAYLQMMDEFVRSPQFDEMATPSGFQSMLAQIPGLGDSPEIAEMLNAPEFQDPSVLKNTIKEGLAVIKMYAAQFTELLSDPSKAHELFAQLPTDIRLALEGVLSGDTTSLKRIVQQLPGVGEVQKRALEDLLDGNLKSDSLVNSVKDVLSDDDQIEAARQQFLQDPSMAEAFGIPLDALHDKNAWASLMKEGIEALNSLSPEDTKEAEVLAKTKFGAARAL